MTRQTPHNYEEPNYFEPQYQPEYQRWLDTFSKHRTFEQINSEQEQETGNEQTTEQPT